MTHADRIDELLKQGGSFCDDCVSVKAHIYPRQTVNLNCRRLETRGRIVRSASHKCDRCGDTKIVNTAKIQFHVKDDLAAPKVPTTKPQIDEKYKWPWEGAVQSLLCQHLLKVGWVIASTSDTKSKAAGVDVVAIRNGQTLWVTVKGFPRGTDKTNPSTQARHWFSHAMFDLVLYRSANPAIELAAAFPAGFKTYSSLAKRVGWLRTHMPASIYWVAENGEVTCEGS